MPEVSRFLGIVIAMFYNDHGPPHFHVRYGEHEVVVRIGSGVIEGYFPRRARGFLLEWYDLHVDELRDNWERVQTRRALRKIDPLE
jgi:hypothetical protein